MATAVHRRSFRAVVSTHRWLTLAAIATGLTVGIGAGIPLSRGEPIVAVTVPAILAVVVLLSRIVPSEERVGALATAVVGIGLRLAAASVLFDGALAAGRGGFITGDDANYASLAWGFVQWLRDTPQEPYVPPLWHGNAYLFGTFVYLEAALFALVGPIALVMTSLNALLSGVISLLLYDLTTRLYGRRAAIFASIATALYPSLILWSALNLKDTLTLFIVVTVFWVLARMRARPHWALLVALALLLIPLESLRRYIFVGLILLVPLGVAFAGDTVRRRVAWGASAALMSAALLAVVAMTGGAGGGNTVVAVGGFAGLERTRAGMAVGARTGFVETPPLPVSEGETYVVVAPATVAPTSSGSPGTSATATARPTMTAVPGTPRIVVVAPGTRVTLASASPSAAGPAAVATPLQTAVPSGASPSSIGATAAPEVVVRPGDIVVISTDPRATPAPTGQRQNLTLRSDPAADSVQLVQDRGDTEGLAIARTVAYIPRGLAYTLFAPFPWQVDRTLDAATIPEMVFWYFCLLALPFALWHNRAWRETLPIVLYVAGVLGVFVLVEGNVGTLYRHRAMVIPFVLMLVGPVAITFISRFTRSSPVRRSPS
jgi:hypothetical protein